ncbi:ABC transporter ATP-binding protein [Variovorax sp. PBL-E5]|uniref:ABC transporter ATP-binding protein n=1 Tax=Variovorax sp. PBL-E5 TaxID=434014 RepID=UPI001318219D|nr:ABC transporter ATP-binding protein [Variovorax sp. PBL-E5]VTU20881.1 LIV-I protein F [Variovorax sp. PBL-E5]
MTPAEPIVAVQGLAAYYGRTQVLFDVGFEVRSGGVTALLGANGAGKTTTLMALSGLVQREGDIRLCGVQGRRLAAESVARLGVAHVPADRGTFMPLSAEENLLLGAYLHRNRQEVARDLERMYAYFPRLRQRRHQQAGTLSGGEQQMLAIARALMLRPTLLMLDEPSFGLAPLVVQEVYQILRTVRQQEGLSMLLVEQNANLAFGIATQVYLLETGRVVAHGTPDQMRCNDAVRQAYLGH